MQTRLILVVMSTLLLVAVALIGLTWQLARLQEPRISQAWARWDFDWDARPGQYVIRVKAADERGHTQPESVPWNEQGYLYNAVVDHPVMVA